MGKLLKFPDSYYKGQFIDRSAIRITALEKRLGTIEQRISNYQDDMNFINSCMEEDEHEMSELLKELAQIKGFAEEICE